MLINDFSQQEFLSQEKVSHASYLELITAGIIFIAPILFLVLLAS